MQAENSPVKESIDLLILTKEQITQLLSGPDDNMILTSITAGMNNLINRLSHMSGVPAQASKVVEFPPVTNFMGEELKVRTAPSTDDTEVTQSEKEKFLERVDKLFAEFESLPSEVIINAYSSASDVLVLRGVAKRAGIEEYQEAEINIPLIEAIAAGIKLKNHDDAVQKQIEEEKAKADDIETVKLQLADAQREGADLTAAIDKQKKALESAKEKEKPAIEARIKELIEQGDKNMELQISLETTLNAMSA